MILSDGDIMSRLDDGSLVVRPLDDPEQQIQPGSIDVRLGTRFSQLPGRDVIRVDDPDLNGPEVEYELGSYVPLKPDDFLLATTLEYVEIPDDILSNVEGRSSIGRLAVEVHSTAGILDPGYKGEITLEISNNSKKTIMLKTGMRIAQLVFQELKNPAERPYGEDRGSKYQNQNGPQASKIAEDNEV